MPYRRWDPGTSVLFSPSLKWRHCFQTPACQGLSTARSARQFQSSKAMVDLLRVRGHAGDRGTERQRVERAAAAGGAGPPHTLRGALRMAVIPQVMPGAVASGRSSTSDHLPDEPYLGPVPCRACGHTFPQAAAQVCCATCSAWQLWTACCRISRHLRVVHSILFSPRGILVLFCEPSRGFCAFFYSTGINIEPSRLLL